MRERELTGKVQTVLGIIDADSLGVTLPHEHLLCDMSWCLAEPIEDWVPSGILSEDELKITDEKLAIKEAMAYKYAGGSTIVDLSCIGVSPNSRRGFAVGLAHISQATDLNIVMGTGYYRKRALPPELTTKTEEEITEEIVREIMVGVSDTGVRAGIIGEVGCSNPLEDFERKSLRASAAAQRRTGAAINIHPSFPDDALLGDVKILSDAGADLSRVIISHCRSVYAQRGVSRTTLLELAHAGCYIEFENIRWPTLFGPSQDAEFRACLIGDFNCLIDEGYLSHILISHNVSTRGDLRTYGGHGYAHILHNVVPWMRWKGISEEQIRVMMVENPKRVLPFAPAKE